MGKIENLKQLDSLLRNPKGYTIKELRNEFDSDPTDRTVRNYIKAIQSEPYNMELEKNLSRGAETVYRYKDIKKPCAFFNNEGGIIQKLGDAISSLEDFKGNPQYDWVRYYLITLQNKEQDSREYIGFDGNAYLWGMEFFEPIADAIIHKYPLKLSYKPYFKPASDLYIHPYYLKQFNNRWYLLARLEDKDAISVYPLDRIQSVEHLSKSYIDTDIDFTEYFEDVIGVSIYDVKVEKIEIRVSKARYQYIKTKPIHSSQTELKNKETNDTVTLTIEVKPNKELIALLLSYGSDVTVISPISLKNQMKEIVAKMNEQYS